MVKKKKVSKIRVRKLTERECFRLMGLRDNEIDKIANRSELNESSLSNLYKLVDVLKDVTEVEGKEMGIYGN